MRRYWMFKALKMLPLFALFIVAAGVVVMLLWNALIPAIFGFTEITWIQALGLMILARILVGGRGHVGGSGGRRRWRERWEKKMASMSDDERKKWKEEFGRSCWGQSSAGGEGPTGEGPMEAKTGA